MYKEFRPLNQTGLSQASDQQTGCMLTKPQTGRHPNKTAEGMKIAGGGEKMWQAWCGERPEQGQQ